MSISSIVALVFAIFGGLQLILSAIGVALPATNTVGVWCRKLSVDLKWVLGFEKTVEAVVPAVSGATGAAAVVSAVESVIK